MDLVSPEAIKEIFDSFIELATQNQIRLVINHPSDLFQVEASYNIEPESIKIFIHIPMVPTDSHLCLLKFHPFLLPFTDTHSLLPDLDNSILFLSSGPQTGLHNKIIPASLPH
jgi:hypothetical protein